MRSAFLNDKFTAPRRRFVMGAALLGVGSLLGGASGCSLTGGGTPTNIDPKVIDEINQAISQTCNTAVVVAASTIVAVVLAKFPAFALLTTLAPNAAQEVATFICKLIPPVKAAGELKGALSVQLGDKSVEVHGWHMVDGKAVWF